MGGQIQAAYNIFPGWRSDPLVVRRSAFPSLVGGSALTGCALVKLTRKASAMAGSKVLFPGIAFGIISSRFLRCYAHDEICFRVLLAAYNIR